MRVILKYTPELKGAVEGYIVNFLRKNYWKVEATMEWEDAMQEARLTFFKLASKYSDVKEPQHFMALFKTAWANHFTDLTHRDTTARKTKLASQMGAEEGDGDEVLGSVVGDLDNEGALMVLIRQAPREVGMVLALFLSAPSEILDLAQSSWKGQGKYRVDGNCMVNKLLGFPEGQDSLGLVEKYFVGKSV